MIGYHSENYDSLCHVFLRGIVRGARALGCWRNGSICGNRLQSTTRIHERIAKAVNYSVQKRRFASENDLLSFLGGLPFAPGEQVGIVAGHFMLMYDEAERLVPMVHQDARNPKVKELSQKMAGDFPLRTFKLGVNLVKNYQIKEIASKLALIVNDHVFQTDGWSLQNLKDKTRTGDLRREFYRGELACPSSFRKELADNGWNIKDILLTNTHTRRDDDGILPSDSFCFSETVLRRRFDRATRPELTKLETFVEKQLPGGLKKLYFRPESKPTEFCLTENGDCGCGGEIVELLIQLGRRSLAGLILFIPSECMKGVVVGGNAFFDLPAPMRGSLCSIAVVDGFGGMGKAASNPSNEGIEAIAFTQNR